MNTHCEHTKISNCANELQAEGYGLWQRIACATNLNHHVSTLLCTVVSAILLSLRSDLRNEHRVLTTMTWRMMNMIQSCDHKHNGLIPMSTKSN